MRNSDIIMTYLANERSDMVNSGKMCKNLTDGLLIAVSLVALLGVLLGYLSFDGEYFMDHPTTGEEIKVSSPFDDPCIRTYAVLFVAFLIAAVIGFSSRRFPLVGILASVCTVVISVNYFADGLIDSWPIIYVLVAVTGLAGNLIYTCLHYFENTTEGEKE